MKKGPSNALPLRSSNRIQKEGCSALQIQPHAAQTEGTGAVAEQSSPHTVVGSIGKKNY